MKLAVFITILEIYSTKYGFTEDTVIMINPKDNKLLWQQLNRLGEGHNRINDHVKLPENLVFQEHETVKEGELEII